MALPQYNTEELIKSIKRRCTVPTSQLTYEDEDFAALATDEMQDVVIPLIMSTKSEYFLDFEDYSTDNTGVITLPSAAVGEKVRSVCFKQQDNPLILNNVPRIDLDVIAGIGPINYNFLTGFYIQDNKLMLYPNTSVPTGTSVRVYYFKRTMVLAAPTAYAQISSIDTLNLSFVVDSVPSGWTAGTRINAVSSTPSFKTTNELMIISSVSSPTIFVDNVTDLSVGDYVSLEGYSAVPQIPLEAHAFLAQLTAVKCLEGIADRPGMEVAQAKANQLAENMMVFFTNRVDGSVKKVVNPNGGIRYGSGLGGGKFWGYGRGWF